MARTYLVRVQLCPWHKVWALAAGQPDPQASAAILCHSVSLPHL